MDNFARAIRIALRHRWNVAGCILCALVVAVLWGGNISAVYPLVEVCMRGKTLSDWAGEKIAAAEQERDALNAQLAQLEPAGSAPNSTGPAALAADQLRSRIASEHAAIDRFQKVKPWLDEYLPDDPFQTILVVMAGLLVGTCIKDLFMVFNSILVDRLAHLTAFDIRNQLFRKSLRADLASFNEQGTADLLSRFTNDMDGVAHGVQTFFGRATSEPLKALACLAGAAWVSWRLLLLSLLVAPPAIYLIAMLAKKLKRANRRAMEVVSTLYGVLVESLQGVKVVKAFTMERYERRRFHDSSKLCYQRIMRIARYDAIVSPLTELLGISGISLTIVFGAYLAINRQTHLWIIPISDRPLELGSLVMFYAMLAGLSDPARKLSEVFNRLQRASAASDRVFELIDREPTIDDPVAPRDLPPHHREIVFDDVSFHYQTGQRVLEHVQLRIGAGETIAIVGPNGCGKSTLANLLPRFYDPIAGRVLIDGVDIRQLRLTPLRQQIGLVTQETLLFNDTVLNNIRYGTPQATDEQVMAAAKQAHAHRFIEHKLERGYQTLVGPQGSKLSGGQRQRIALARAILRNPAILILDEATSQVDLESEQLIHRVLAEFTRNRTAIMITHRLSTLELADRIVVMDAGRIIDHGTHEQLLARCELYQRLTSSQFRHSA